MNRLLVQAGRIGLLALMVWREARYEPWGSKLAMAYVAVTRAETPGKSWWGDDLLAVLFAPNQFSSLTYKADPQLTWFPREGDTWLECLKAAAHALYGWSPNPAPGATHYFTLPLTTVPAAWGPMEHVADVGTAHFYKERK